MAKARRAKAEAMREGYAGAVLVTSRVRVTAIRHETRSLRCRPGTFEWRYGRENADAALYHAGIALAGLWERAEVGSSASPDLRRAGGSGWKGLPESRLEALDLIRALRVSLDKHDRWSMPRLVDYCVLGTPAREIAQKESDCGRHVSAREMALVLEGDLRAAADHFRLV